MPPATTPVPTAPSALSAPTALKTATPPDQLDHLSWSGIQTYARCPKKFRFRYIEHAPAERVSAALVFGSAFHRAAVERIHEARLAGRALPSIGQLLSAYEGAWSEQSKDRPEIVFAKGEDRDSQRQTARRMLEAYRAHVASEKQPAQVLGIEEEALFRLLPNAPPLKARLDLLEWRGNELLITDVKTSRCRWNEEKVRESLPQLVVYAHAVMPLLRALNAGRIVPRFVIVTKAKRPAVQVIEPHATQDDARRLKELAAETWSAVQAGVFPRRESWACGSCGHRQACLGR